MEVIAGIDLGATNVRIGLFRAGSSSLSSISFQKERIKDRTPEGVADLINDMLRDSHMPKAIGIGVPGMVDRNGIVRRAPNLDWTDVDFASLLSSRVGAPVRMLNDLNAITWGEYILGHNAQNMICVFMGTGIGAGVVIDGRLVEGEHGMAGEVGHTKVWMGGEPRMCGCGSRGCLEAYLGGGNFPAWVRDELAVWEGPKPELPEDLHPGVIDALASRGEPFALMLWDRAASVLAGVLASMVVLLDPGRIVMGGTVWKGCSRLRKLTQDRLRDMVPPAFEPEVVTSELGDEAGIWGAAYMALSMLREESHEA